MDHYTTSLRDAEKWDEHFHQKERLAHVGELHELQAYSPHPDFKSPIQQGQRTSLTSTEVTNARASHLTTEVRKFKSILDADYDGMPGENASQIAKKRDFEGETRRTNSGWGDLNIPTDADRYGASQLPKGPGGTKSGWGDLDTEDRIRNANAHWGNTTDWFPPVKFEGKTPP